jgi:hypothetical protein
VGGSGGDGCGEVGDLGGERLVKNEEPVVEGRADVPDDLVEASSRSVSSVDTDERVEPALCRFDMNLLGVLPLPAGARWQRSTVDL